MNRKRIVLIKVLIIIILLFLLFGCPSASIKKSDDSTPAAPSTLRTAFITVTYSGGTVNSSHPILVGIYNNPNTSTWTTSNITNAGTIISSPGGVQITTISYSPFYVGVFYDANNNGVIDSGEANIAYNGISMGGTATAVNVAVGGSTNINITF
jgi:hypothetical protein